MYYAAISGVLLILTVILNPEGIVGPVHTQLAALRAKLRARRSPARAVQPVAAGRGGAGRRTADDRPTAGRERWPARPAATTPPARC